jgi:KRAB domain-containing zinc finger protein
VVLRYSCEECPVTRLVFDTFASWHRHRQTIHKGRTEITCPISHCNKQYSTKYHAQQHVWQCHFPQRHKCSYCSRDFGSPSGCYQHTRNKHRPELLLKCRHCDLSFLTKTKLKAHNTYLHDPRPSRCPKCLEEYPTIAALRNHICIRVTNQQERMRFWKVPTYPQSFLQTQRHLRPRSKPLCIVYRNVRGRPLF